MCSTFTLIFDTHALAFGFIKRQLTILHDHCSKGLNGHYHNWNNCGYHYEEFNNIEAKFIFR